MICENYTKAKEQAQANADQTGKSWGVFSGTPLTHHTEPWRSCMAVLGAEEVRPRCHKPFSLIRFSRYGDAMESIKFAEMQQLSDNNEIVARAEDSGCESVYVEIARWNETSEKWQRFAFIKMLDVHFEDQPDLSDWAKAARIVSILDNGLAMIHDMESYNG